MAVHSAFSVIISVWSALFVSHWIYYTVYQTKSGKIVYRAFLEEIRARIWCQIKSAGKHLVKTMQADLLWLRGSVADFASSRSQACVESTLECHLCCSVSWDDITNAQLV